MHPHQQPGECGPQPGTPTALQQADASAETSHARDGGATPSHGAAAKPSVGTRVLRLRGLPFTATESDIRLFFTGYAVHDILIAKRQVGCRLQMIGIAFDSCASGLLDCWIAKCFAFVGVIVNAIVLLSFYSSILPPFLFALCMGITDFHATLSLGMCYDRIIVTPSCLGAPSYNAARSGTKHTIQTCSQLCSWSMYVYSCTFRLGNIVRRTTVQQLAPCRHVWALVLINVLLASSSSLGELFLPIFKPICKLMLLHI